MSRLIRFLSRRRTGRGINTPSDGTDEAAKKKGILPCKVHLLDGTDMTVDLPKKALASVLYEKVFYHLDIVESDYFGLEFLDNNNVRHWLESQKKVKKQMKNHKSAGPTYVFTFHVKFYPNDPHRNLREEITRYQYFLQLKADVLAGHLKCTFEECVELAAYAIQSELGDYDEDVHNPGVISEFRFIEDQTEDMELAILEKFKTLKGQTPATAEVNYLSKACRLNKYGLDLRQFRGRDGSMYSLSMTPTGILILDNDEKIGFFIWKNISKIQFKGKKLTLAVTEGEENEQTQEHIFVFKVVTERACKEMWKCAVEQHTFFRLQASPKEQNIRQNFFRLSSRFRYSGMTESQRAKSNHARMSVKFERSPSQRYSRRSKFEGENSESKTQVENRGANKNRVAADDAASCDEFLLEADFPSSKGRTQGKPRSSIGSSCSGSVAAAGLSLSAEERLDNLIKSPADDTMNGSFHESLSPKSQKSPSISSYNSTLAASINGRESEAMNSKHKGLDNPLTRASVPPKPYKDVNTFMNNQLKFDNSTAVAPVIKCNVLKAQSDSNCKSDLDMGLMVDLPTMDDVKRIPMQRNGENHITNTSFTQMNTSDIPLPVHPPPIASAVLDFELPPPLSNQVDSDEDFDLTPNIGVPAPVSRSIFDDASVSTFSHAGPSDSEELMIDFAADVQSSHWIPLLADEMLVDFGLSFFASENANSAVGPPGCSAPKSTNPFLADILTSNMNQAKNPFLTPMSSSSFLNDKSSTTVIDPLNELAIDYLPVATTGASLTTDLSGSPRFNTALETSFHPSKTVTARTNITSVSSLGSSKVIQFKRVDHPDEINPANSFARRPYNSTDYFYDCPWQVPPVQHDLTGGSSKMVHSTLVTEL